MSLWLHRLLSDKKKKSDGQFIFSLTFLLLAAFNLQHFTTKFVINACFWSFFSVVIYFFFKSHLRSS